MTRAAKDTFRPSRRRGQNFLFDRGIQRRIAEAARVPVGATVVEIGAGTGNLTEVLLERGLRVVAVEVEPELAGRLVARFSRRPALMVVNADARRVDLARLAGGCYHVVANLPYSVGTRIVVDLLQSLEPPLSMTVLLQREVAQRMVAEPDNMALLSVIVQSMASARTLFDVPAEAFRPRPKVISTLVRLEPNEPGPLERPRISRRIAIARHGFAQPRKKLRNSLAAGLRVGEQTVEQALTRANIDPSRRPGTLSLTEWDAIAQALEADVVAVPPAPGTRSASPVGRDRRRCGAERSL